MASPSAAQRNRLVAPVDAGSEWERYLRTLSMLGWAPPSQWTVRVLTPTEVAAISTARADPWRGKMQLTPAHAFSIVVPTLSGTVNSGFAYGFNDGPVWSGRGLTTVASGGVRVERGPVSLVANPVAFFAQNAGFPIADNGLTGDRRYADWSRPDLIDRPQRFGSSSYSRIDPGESEFRITALRLAAGVSSRSEIWGPAYDHPLILGNNAGGIPRLFAGTASPLRLGRITLHGRVMWGRLVESNYGPDTGSMRKHFATGGVATVGLGGTGIELGAARFFHTEWPSRLQDAPWLRLGQELLSSNPRIGFGSDNQLASLFFRAAPPGSGFEIYGEFGREDRNASTRDLYLEPDHIAAYLLGIARAWGSPDSTQVTVVRAEVLNSRISHLQQQRSQTPWYVHTGQLNGHTHRGQVLGSAGGFGGAASVVAVDRYTPGGRITVRWDRINHATPVTDQGLPVADRTDVFHSVGVERSRFTSFGRLTLGGALIREFNRYFGDDAFNAQVRAELAIIR
jgi:hypothetical protein